MAQAAHHGPFAFAEHLLNIDGRPHPVENRYAIATLLVGAVAAIFSIWNDMHLISSWAGLVGIALGARAQMISVTTAQRFLAVLGLGAAGLGLYLGLAHGGPFGGVLG
ncbi:hypothetical protein E1265_19730 [Streptomyces sp. 8K308]|uniref:hypothetical protein n=1 Tax=Streptomyces sp. 8K308 TaxID=2530388 RepID=UPI00104390D4|nr:hypothetical protein [Streptomyces sp. 8K308]TDC20919.1 hypothetical protein E1265_19730 [Streptomyces sp. 8K308]